MAGTIAAATHNGTGGAGVTWSGKVMPVRVLGRGGGTSYDVLQGIRYAAGLDNDSGTVPAQAADIINLSLGGSSYSSSEQALYTQIRNAGIIVAAAAGNSGSSTKSYPAAYDDVVSVSAVDKTKALADYSNYGSTIDVAAPGGETNLSSADGIYSTVGDDTTGSVVMTYAFYQGTSMATPHVAGVAALMKAVYPAMAPDEFDGLLQSGAITEDLGVAGRDNSFGYGLIDAQLAVAQAAALAGGGSLPATLVVAPNALSFGTAQTAMALNASRSGSGALTINSVTDDAAWLTVAPGSVDADGLGTYTARVDRTALSVGTHTGTITFDSNVNDIEIPVTVQVSSGVAGSNEGYHYVILLDPDTLNPKYQAAGTTVSGELDYTLSGVQPGAYRLFSGTDADNNGTIGDAGESIGAYTSLESPVTISVSTNRSGLNFDAEFNLVNQPSSAGTGTAATFGRHPARTPENRKIGRRNAPLRQMDPGTLPDSGRGVRAHIGRTARCRGDGFPQAPVIVAGLRQKGVFGGAGMDRERCGTGGGKKPKTDGFRKGAGAAGHRFQPLRRTANGHGATTHRRIRHRPGRNRSEDRERHPGGPDRLDRTGSGRHGPPDDHLSLPAGARAPGRLSPHRGGGPARHGPLPPRLALKKHPGNHRGGKPLPHRESHASRNRQNRIDSRISNLNLVPEAAPDWKTRSASPLEAALFSVKFDIRGRGSP